jgi:hypothetical protein
MHVPVCSVLHYFPTGCLGWDYRLPYLLLTLLVECWSVGVLCFKVVLESSWSIRTYYRKDEVSDFLLL